MIYPLSCVDSFNTRICRARLWPTLQMHALEPASTMILEQQLHLAAEAVSVLACAVDCPGGVA